MKTMWRKIVYWFWYLIGLVVSSPSVAIAYIIKCIKHESYEAYIRRAFRMVPNFVKGDITEDIFVDLVLERRP